MLGECFVRKLVKRKEMTGVNFYRLNTGCTPECDGILNNVALTVDFVAEGQRSDVECHQLFSASLICILKQRASMLSPAKQKDWIHKCKIIPVSLKLCSTQRIDPITYISYTDTCWNHNRKYPCIVGAS